MASVFESILSQVKDTITALNLSGTPTVLVRKKFIIHESDEAPLVIVSPLTEGEADGVGGSGFEEALDIMYPVLVAIVTETGQLLTASGNAMLAYRQSVRRALRSVKVLSIPLAPCNNVHCDLNPPFDLQAGRDNLDVSAMVLTYTVNEPRNP